MRRASSMSIVKLVGSIVSSVALACIPVTQIWALSSDAEQPIEIEADFAELDDQEGTTVYVGNVIVVQGSIRMTGDKFRVIFSEERELQDAYMEGRPAYFKQTPDGGAADVEGEALTIEYHRLQNLVHLIENAKVTQADRLFEGYRINYDTAKSLITARAATRTSPLAAEQPARKPGRVRVVIPPRKKKK